MKCLVRQIIRKSRGGIALKENTVEASEISAGRGNDRSIHLPDPRVLLHHAEFSLRGGDVYMAPAPGADVRVNGNLTQMVKLTTGDVVKVGPYDLILEDNDRTDTITLSVELVQPMGDDLDRIIAQAKVNTGRFSTRVLSWFLALVVAILMFTMPWVASWFHESSPLLIVLNTRDRAVPAAPTKIWSTGGISASHRFFGDSCETCHVTPFVPVQDGTCLTCHENVEHHADPKRFSFAAFEDQSCQNCHKEHQGHQSIARSDDAFCAGCHRDLPARTRETTLRIASDFGTDHPDFRPTVVIDSALHVVDRSRAITDSPTPKEDASLDFPHDKHLRTGGVRDPARGNVVLECANCHQTDGGGGYMLPISFDKHCHQCHALKFDAFVPDRELVHGKPEEMFKQVRDVYDAVAMRGGYTEPEAPPLIRRRPGIQLTTEQKKEVLDWSVAKTAAIMNGRFGRGLCEGCHQTFDSTASAGQTGAGWGVEPVSASNIWFPKSQFSHGNHRDMECGSCHDAKNSLVSSDILMPSIATCRACHGGEHATDKVPSTCISCHAFHRQDLDAMKITLKLSDPASASPPAGKVAQP